MTVTRQELDAAGLTEFETPQEHADRFIRRLRSYTTRIELLGSQDAAIDVTRAINGLVEGDIVGDRVNPMLGTVLLLEAILEDNLPLSARNLAFIKSGFGNTWLASTRAIEEFGPRLAPQTLDKFTGIFSKYQEFMSAVISGTEQNIEAIIKVGHEFHQDLQQDVWNNPDSDVLYYANNVTPLLLAPSHNS